MTKTELLFLAAITSASWALACVRHRRAAPIAIALVATTALDLFRELALPPRLDLALYLLHPGIGALSARAVLSRLRVRPRDAWVGPSLVALLAPSPATWWSTLLAVTWTCAVGSELCSMRAWARCRRNATTTELAALTLVACDVAALVELVVAQWDAVRVVGWISWSVLLVLGISAQIR